MKQKQRLSRDPLPQLNASESPATQSLFRKLESLEKEMDAQAHAGQTRWIIPYADLLTLLLGFFLVLFASSGMTMKKIPLTSLAAKPPIANAASKKKVDAAQTAKAARSSQEQKLVQRLQSQLHINGVEIRSQERGLVISMEDGVLFAPGQADLSPAARQTLDRLSAQLSGNMGNTVRPIRVEGHTDDTPINTAQYPSNWELSTARATNIVRYLITARHFPPQKLSAAGYGEFRPVKDNSSIEGKQKNRRVDIVVLNDDAAHQEPPLSFRPAFAPEPVDLTQSAQSR